MLRTVDGNALRADIEWANAQKQAKSGKGEGESLEALLGPTLVSAGGGTTATSQLVGMPVAIYFSAHWCPPCRFFTPQLADFYRAIQRDAKGQIVFVSLDNDEEQFDEYLDEMPWLAVPFSDEKRREAIQGKFQVQGVPTLVVLDAQVASLA